MDGTTAPTAPAMRAAMAATPDDGRNAVDNNMGEILAELSALCRCCALRLTLSLFARSLAVHICMGR